MALDWNAYLADGTLNQSDQEWPDLSTPTATRPLLATAPASNNQSSQGHITDSEIISPYQGIENADAYFTDAFYQTDGDFLRSLDILEPFDAAFAESSTSDSSPEPLSTADLFNQALFAPPPAHVASRTSRTLKHQNEPTEVPSRKMSVGSTSSQRSRANDPTFASENGFSDGLTFTNDLSSALQTYGSELDQNTESISVSKEPETTTKRARQRNADKIAACWTSPLCPNHNEDGSPPDPTTCGGACAPFLFASTDESNSPIMLDPSVLGQNISITDNSSQPPPNTALDMTRGIKRSESESSSAPSGRVFPKPSRKSRTASTAVRREPSTSHLAAADDDGDSTSPDAHTDLPSIPPHPSRRQPHNQVERKYRESLNTQLESLRRVVPSLQPQEDESPPAGAQSSSQGCADIEDLPAARKPSKAVVLASATAYIRQMEKEKKMLVDENQKLKSRVKALQALVKCEDCTLMQYVMNLKIQAPS